MLTLYSYPRLFSVADIAVDAGIYGFIANIYYCDIDTPLKQFVVAHDNLVRHCRAIHAMVSA